MREGILSFCTRQNYACDDYSMRRRATSRSAGVSNAAVHREKRRSLVRRRKIHLGSASSVPNILTHVMVG